MKSSCFLNAAKRIALLIISLLAFSSFNSYNKSLLSFTTSSGKRLALIVKSEIVCVYFGHSTSHIESCQKLNDPNGPITYAYYMRPASIGESYGVDLNHIRFNHAGFRYDIYEEYGEDGSVFVGVRITHLRTGANVDEPAQKGSVKGSMIGIRGKEILPEVPCDF